MRSALVSFGAAVAIGALSLVSLSAAAGQNPAPSSADYVGESTCLSCHPTQSYKGTAHAVAANAKTPAATHGCESCHGPGRSHVDGGGDTASIKNPGSLPVKEGIAVCGACHDRGAHPALAGAPAPVSDTACTSCHSVHHATAPKLLKRMS